MVDCEGAIRLPGNFPIGQGDFGCSKYPFPITKTVRFWRTVLLFNKAKLHPLGGIPKEIKTKEILLANCHMAHITPFIL